MNGFIRNLKENVKKIDKFSIGVLIFGLRISFGLIVISALMYTLLGHTGDYITTLICAKGALQAAPTVFVTTVIGAFLSDIIIKDRMDRD